jgi:hypothetical protein
MRTSKTSKKFRVPDKMLWHTKAKAFAGTGQWANLRKLADSRTKSFIGYKPFAHAGIKYGQSSSEIMRYIEQVTVTEERYSLFCEAGMWKRVLEEAAKLRDERRIIDVKARCGNPDIQLQADQFLARLA